MIKYAIIANPGHNRVYFETSKQLSKAELGVAIKHFSVVCSPPQEEYIENVFYITFTTEQSLSEHDLDTLSRLSFVYAIFKCVTIDEIRYLLPVARTSYQYIDDNISSILKYTGKTNELFTRMMINVGVNSTRFVGQRIKMLDPVAGKGTTLYEGLIYGYDVYGIEIGDKVVNEAYAYMRRFLESEKYKHQTHTEKISGEHKSFSAKRFIIDIAKDKDELKNKATKHFEMVAGNSAFADKYYKKNTFHLIVGDMPYGVQHGNITNEKQSSITRNPKELLKACLKGWHNVLKSGGALVLGWNNFVFPREVFVSLLESYGFEVKTEPVYLEFEHRVDQSIRRDIIVAIKA